MEGRGCVEGRAGCGKGVGSRYIGDFDQLLRIRIGVETFEQFLESEFCEENMLFWRVTQMS